jgi:NAD(P)-dependent dehydrogenase (short-subunit alcohol dehydrogenase family)
MDDPTFPDLDGASVFVTGGGSGIGAALTEGFLRQGARVAFIGRSDYSGFAEEMEAATGRRPLFLRGDVTDNASLFDAMDRAADAHGPITRLVNNAADDDRHDLLDVTEDYWRAQIDVNLKAYLFACQHVVRRLKAAGLPGRIVNFSSISYMMGNGGYAIYTAANAAIVALTHSVARDFGPDGIRANAIAPGWVLTEKQKDLWADPDSLKAHLGRQCLPEHLVPADMVGPTLFLASDAARMMTGQVMAVAGGVVVSG